MKKCDIAIVGAGPGGLITALSLENSGLNVFLIDQKHRNTFGEKVCGDAISKHHFDFLHKKLGLNYPDAEIRNHIKGINIFSPDKKTCFDVQEKEGGYIIDRNIFCKNISSMLENTNILDNNEVIKLYDKKLILKNTKNGDIEKIEPNIIVDSSGCRAILRRQVISKYIQQEIDTRDLCICYREIRKYELKNDYCDIYLDQKMSKGGYVWIFPSGKNVNVGIGVQYPLNPKQKFYGYIKNSCFRNSEIIHKGAGIILLEDH